MIPNLAKFHETLHRREIQVEPCVERTKGFTAHDRDVQAASGE